MEDFDLSDVAQKAEPDEEEDNQKGRSNRTLASPSEFRLAIVNAFLARQGEVIKIDPKGTSYTCHLCNTYQKLDHTTIYHTCSNCNQTWDREDNATANLLKRYCERLSGEENAGGARKDENNNEIKGVQETRYQRRNRAKQEKLARQTTARKDDANPA